MKNDTIIDVDFTKEDTKETVVDKLANGVKSIGRGIVTGLCEVGIFCVENPIAAAMIAGTATTAIQSGAKMYIAHCDMIKRERDFYDPRTGKHSQAKRKLDAYEQAFIADQYNSGRSYAEILYDMDILK